MRDTLEGKVAIVAGAGPGIGRATALALAGDRAALVLAARRAQPLEALAREVAEASGQRAIAVPTDIGVAAGREALLRRAVDELGRVDVLVNVAAHAAPRAEASALDADAYLESVRLNVLATMDLCGRAAREMARSGGGSIINIGALSSTTLIPRMTSYTSTKAAMVVASKTMAREMGRDGIRVNVVTPGFISGPPLDRMFEDMARRGGGDAAELEHRAALQAALQRHVDPEDIAEACLFLASDRGRNVTGVELHVNAGQWIGGRWNRETARVYTEPRRPPQEGPPCSRCASTCAAPTGVPPPPPSSTPPPSSWRATARRTAARRSWSASTTTPATATSRRR